MINDHDDSIAPPTQLDKAAIQKHAKAFESGARWFYAIAALSMVNSLIHLSRSEFSFVIGLGISQIIDGIALAITQEAPKASTTIQLIALALNGLFSGIFALFGWLALKRKGWAFVAGMVLYVLDGLLFLFINDWLSLAFHLFAFVCICKGYIGLVNLARAGVSKLQEMELPQVLAPPVKKSPQEKYQRRKRTTWIASLCVGLPLPLTFLILMAIGYFGKNQSPTPADIMHICITLIVVFIFGAIAFSLPWLIFYISTRRWRATFNSSDTAAD
jgi:uncharacterized membrane protein